MGSTSGAVYTSCAVVWCGVLWCAVVCCGEEALLALQSAFKMYASRLLTSVNKANKVKTAPEVLPLGIIPRKGE